MFGRIHRNRSRKNRRLCIGLILLCALMVLTSCGKTDSNDATHGLPYPYKASG